MASLSQIDKEAKLKHETVRKIHRTLVDAKKYLENLRKPSLSSESLTEIKIRLFSLDLHSEHGIDFEPRFCRPFPADEFEQVLEAYTNSDDSWLKKRNYLIDTSRMEIAKDNALTFNEILRDLECGDLESKMMWAGRAQCGRYKSLSSYNYERHERQTWKMEYIRHAMPLPKKPQTTRQKETNSSRESQNAFVSGWILDDFRPGPAQPHIACSVANCWAADDTKLFRSEILAAMHILITHVQQRAAWDFYVHPVFIYSFTGDDARVLQIHFDVASGTFFVRMSPFVHVDTQTPLEDWTDNAAFEQNEENIKLLLRWMTNIPIGDTSCKSIYQQEKDFEALQDQPPTPSKKSLKVV